MMSEGCDDPPSSRCGDSSIMIDGFELSPKVSHVTGYTDLVDFHPRGVLRYISNGDVRSPFLGLKSAI